MSATYPALTLWEPWASLVAAGAKSHEWRIWPAPRSLIGKRVAIHAGARKPKKDEIAELLMVLRTEDWAGTSLNVDLAIPLLERWHTSPGMLPTSSVLCIATLGQPISALQYARAHDMPVQDRDIDYARWAWPLTDIEKLEPFVPAKGAQGFWPWERP